MGSIYLNVLHIVLALALDFALGPMLLIILVMVIGFALFGDLTAAIVVAGAGHFLQVALDDFLGHHCPTKCWMPNMPRNTTSECAT